MPASNKARKAEIRQHAWIEGTTLICPGMTVVMLGLRVHLHDRAGAPPVEQDLYASGATRYNPNDVHRFSAEGEPLLPYTCQHGCTIAVGRAVADLARQVAALREQVGRVQVLPPRVEFFRRVQEP